MRPILAVLGKDLRLELRTFETLPAMVLFSISTFVIFHFGFGRENVHGQLAAGILTVTLLFAALLGAGRLFVAEREQGGFDAFLLAPVDRTALLLAKATAMIAESCRASRKKLLRRHLAQRRNLFAKAVALGDVRAALAVLADEALGRDLVVSAQTGSGKTVAFGLAVLALRLTGRG